MKKHLKRPYSSPTVEEYTVEMEMGIAAGSLDVGENDTDVQDEWDEEDQGFDFEWDYKP